MMIERFIIVNEHYIFDNETGKHLDLDDVCVLLNMFNEDGKELLL